VVPDTIYHIYGVVFLRKIDEDPNPQLLNIREK